MRRVGAASLATVSPTARPARNTAAKEGDVTEMFAESIQVPACVIPAAPEAAPAVAEAAPSRAERGFEPTRPTWHQRMTRAIAARFRKTPREESQGPDPRLERFQSRRSGLDPSN